MVFYVCLAWLLGVVDIGYLHVTLLKKDKLALARGAVLSALTRHHQHHFQRQQHLYSYISALTNC